MRVFAFCRRFAEELLTLGAAQPNTNCTTDDPNQVNLPCYDMRTSSRYQDVWILPAATSHVLHPQSAATGVASAENHEYIVGRCDMGISASVDMALERISYFDSQCNAFATGLVS